MSIKTYVLSEKNQIIVFCENVHSIESNTKFCWAVSKELCWENFFSSIFNFGQISKFERGIIPPTQMIILLLLLFFFLAKYAHLLSMSFISYCNYKVSRNSDCWAVFKGVALKKNRTDGLTDWLAIADWRTGQEALYPPVYATLGVYWFRLKSLCLGGGGLHF